MTIKIDAPRITMGHSARNSDDTFRWSSGTYRRVRESDWRKVMAVVRAIDEEVNHASVDAVEKTDAALVALRKHLVEHK